MKSSETAPEVKNPLGISVVICCHNSAKRLPATLGHLKVQRAPGHVEWEVIVIDNASTDDTAEVAKMCWAGHPVPMRVIHEPHLGTAHARARGLHEARNEIVGFIDDDNWVCEEWIAVASQVLSSVPGIGAVGSLVYPVFERHPPTWWYELATGYYALLLQAPQNARFLTTAGLAIRKSAWEQVVNSGFKFHLQGRRGAGLIAGEDTELTYALFLSGWRLIVDERMRLLHFLPALRLTWPYFRRLVRATAVADTICSPLVGNETQSESRLKGAWAWQTAKAFRKSILRPRAMCKWIFSSVEGDPYMAVQERALGRLFGLLRYRAEYIKLTRAEARSHG